MELGYSEMRGVYNYLNGTAVPDHSCSETWEKELTYTISSANAAANAAALAGRSVTFERLLRSGGYRYAVRISTLS